jgi:hypothetical protein
MNVRTLRLSTLGACLLAIGAVALNTSGDAGAPPPPPPPNGYGGVIQSCGPDNYSYCYGESWDSSVTYQSTNSFPIAILFNSGSLEGCCDWVQIYDGLDNFAPLIGQYTNSLTGLFAASTNADHALFVVFHSDGSVSCQSGAEPMPDWTVSCLDCTAPAATFDIQLDCDLSFYNVIVNITAMGTDPSIDITNTGGAATVVATTTGTYTVGPFTPGQEVQVTLENELNPLCNVNSGSLTNSPCPIISCGPNTYDYCYANDDVYTVVYQGNTSFPLRLQFNSGGIYQFDGDLLTIYDGLNDLAPPLYSGTGVNGDLSGIFVTSTNPDHALTLKMVSTPFTGCADGNAFPWNYTVGCLDCNPPTGTGGTLNVDCAAGTYTISVEVTDLGTDPQIEIGNDVGVPATVVTAPGSYLAGPFPVNAPVVLTLINDANALCNVELGEFENLPCPIISCGPDNYNYCYQNADTYIQIFQGTSTFPLRLQFNSGGIYQFDGDLLTIYDGLDDLSPPLYSGTGVNGDLTGIIVTSTNPDHALTLKMVSTDFTSCSDGSAVQWDYTVGCLDCDPPAGTAGTVTTDCAAQSFTVSVNVTSLGTDPELEIANDVGAPPTMITTPGTYTAGPFQVGNPVELTLVNDANSLCNVELGEFINTFCPIQVTCGEPAIEQSHCYTGNETSVWLYQNTGTESLAILFSSLIMEGWFYDNIHIYDGVDNTAPELWFNDINNPNNPNTEFGLQNFSGLLVISSGPALYMEASSDFSVSCGDGSIGYVPWEWTVGCLDCTQPDVTFDVQLDCSNNTWFIVSDVASLGSDPTITITNTYDSNTIPVTAPGTYLSGPFPFGITAHVELVTDSNTLCSRRCANTTNPPCPFISCDEAQYQYCYPNSADTAMTYQSANAYPIALIFNAGQMDLYQDSVYIYDGANYLAPLLFSGAGDGDFTGDLYTSSNPANALTMKIRSNTFTACTDNFLTPLNWNVQCLDCTNPTVSFTMIPDCIHNGFQIQVDVDSLGTNAPHLRIANSLNTDTVENVMTGITYVGPFPADSVVRLTVMNSHNVLCRRVSEEFTYPSDSCVNVACDPTGVEYCYTNADTAWFVYTSGTTDPVTINFVYGELLVNDYIQIFNGLDTSAQIVYMGNQGGQIGGLAISSSNPDNALTLLVISSQQGSCASGQGFPPLFWNVGCGLVGQNEFTVDRFAMFPNPTNGDLYVRLADGLTGKVSIDVMDVMGRLVMSEQFNATTGHTERFDLGMLTNGNYAVRLSTDNWSKTEQLQVVR